MAAKLEAKLAAGSLAEAGVGRVGTAVWVVAAGFGAEEVIGVLAELGVGEVDDGAAFAVAGALTSGEVAGMDVTD
ncbi:MAG: hypothetical protein U0452_11775 [Anaerolineae bacterium]